MSDESAPIITESPTAHRIVEQPTIVSGEAESFRAADHDRQIEKLKARRAEHRRRITLNCNEIAKILKRVGSRTSLDTLVAQSKTLLWKSEKLTDQLCVFKDKVDTAQEYLSQLEYQRAVEDARQDVDMFSDELFDQE